MFSIETTELLNDTIYISKQIIKKINNNLDKNKYALDILFIELLQIALNESLNTHNNYLFFLLSTGCLGFFTFLISLLYLFKRSLKPLNFLKLSFCVIIAINLLTENILSRHTGLMFVSFMLLLLFNGQKNEINKFEKDI